jgi:hypothetical protein
MEKQTRLDEAAEAKKKGDIVLAEQIYHGILSKSAGNNESALREQESALIQLGELYRDEKFISPSNSYTNRFQTSRQPCRTYKNIQNRHVQLRQSQNCENRYPLRRR